MLSVEMRNLETKRAEMFRGVCLAPPLPRMHICRTMAASSGQSLSVWMSRRGSFPLLWNEYVACKKFHTQAGVRRPGVPRLRYSLPADFVGVIRPLSVLSVPAWKVEVASASESLFLLGPVCWVCSGHFGLAGPLQGRPPVRGLLPPWLPRRNLLTQIFLEALYKGTRLSSKIAHGTGMTFPWKAHVVLSKQAALCSSQGGGPGTDLQGRSKKGKEKGLPVVGGGGLAGSQGPAPAGKVNGPSR